jgi:hypothetical protein
MKRKPGLGSSNVPGRPRTSSLGTLRASNATGLSVDDGGQAHSHPANMATERPRGVAGDIRQSRDASRVGRHLLGKGSPMPRRLRGLAVGARYHRKSLSSHAGQRGRSTWSLISRPRKGVLRPAGTSRA